MAGFPWGGSEELWVVGAKEAVKNNCSVMAAVFDWSMNHRKIRDLQYHGVFLISRPASLSGGILSRVVRKIDFFSERLESCRLPQWIKKIETFDPDVICVSQGNTYESFYNKELSLFLENYSGKLIYICQLNSDNHFIEDDIRRRARHLFQKAGAVLFVSDHNRLLAERQLAIRLANAKIVCNPLNIESLDYVRYPGGNKVIFANVARLDVKYKGQDILFEVLGSSTWRERDWECRLYGEGPHLIYLENLASCFGIADRVKFMGYVDDIRNIWGESHILVMPSRAEGASLALVEAMVCGRPSVLSDVGGTYEWGGKSESSFIADAPTPRSFGLSLERAWQAKEHWEEIGKRAHRYALENIDCNPGRSLLNLFEGIP